jgi:hypothetical protein
MTFDEKGKVIKSVQPIKTPVRTLSYFQVCGVWEGWKGTTLTIEVSLERKIAWLSTGENIFFKY